VTKTQLHQRHSDEHAVAEQLAARIRVQVLQTLGRPPGWHLVQVRPLWDGYFRVNVLIGEGVTSFKISHSFFLLTNANGDVIESTPELVHCY